MKFPFPMLKLHNMTQTYPGIVQIFLDSYWTPNLGPDPHSHITSDRDLVGNSSMGACDE